MAFMGMRKIHIKCEEIILDCVNNQKDALYRLIYYSKSALHVSGHIFAHHEEHLTVFTYLVVFNQVAALCGL